MMVLLGVHVKPNKCSWGPEEGRRCPWSLKVTFTTKGDQGRFSRRTPVVRCRKEKVQTVHSHRRVVTEDSRCFLKGSSEVVERGSTYKPILTQCTVPCLLGIRLVRKGNLT